ncbi:hypothetical protein ACFQHQ_13325 [Zunongwangia atlantica 22II14-10F7]
MTKKFALIVSLIFLITLNTLAQEPSCGCNKKKATRENKYKCDTTLFSNGAKLYWQRNCDSTWLTFENKEKLILKSCEKIDVYECQRTGLDFLKEYPNYLLFQYKWISGCCTPPDIILIDKETGNEIKRINNDQFVWGDVHENYVLFFSDTTYTHLIYLNNETDKAYDLHFDNKQVKKSVIKNNVLQLNDLFNNFIVSRNNFKFDYKTSEGVVKNLKIEFN